MDRWTDGPMDRWTDGQILSSLLDLYLLARDFARDLARDAQAWESQRAFDTLVSNLPSQHYALASSLPLPKRYSRWLRNRATKSLPLAATVCCNCFHD